MLAGQGSAKAVIRSLDELAPGQRFEFGSFVLSEAEIVAFARLYDPQSFHTDAAAAKDSLFGELVASGLHTLSMTFGKVMGSGMFEAVSQGGNRIDARWPAPLRPGEEVAVASEVVELRPSRSGRPIGVAVLRHTATRLVDGVVVMEAMGTHFLRR